MNHTFLKLILLTIVTTFLFTGCVTGPNLVDLNPVGTEYTKEIKFHNKTVPLPEGVWRVIGSGKIGSGNQFFQMILIKENNKKILSDSIIMSVDTKSTFERNNGYVREKRFKRHNYHYKVVKNNSPGEGQDGWLVKHTKMSISARSDVFKQAYDQFKNNNYVLPTTVLESFHRFTGKNIKKKYLTLYYYKNPETDGFTKPYSADWSTSDWHPLHISKYPQKVKYVENFIRFSEEYHQVLKEGFGE